MLARAGLERAVTQAEAAAARVGVYMDTPQGPPVLATYPRPEVVGPRKVLFTSASPAEQTAGLSNHK